ncbi:MAG: hypothetical protein L3J31_08400 [Bacteroidales bacterium]|nr:hypothetical protein [Bacteroidales bacterium]
MKIFQIGLVAGFAFLLVSFTVCAQGDIISAADFTELQNTDNNLVVIDAGKAENYTKSHIKDAINIPAGELNREDGKVHGLLKSPAELAKLLGANGVRESNTIVVYDEGSQKYASRFYWVLKYLGASKVKLLHQDKKAFKKSKVPLSSHLAQEKSAVVFEPRVNEGVLAGAGYLKSGKPAIVDARSEEEFDGSSGYSKGHIPGAVRLNYQCLLDDGGAFLPKRKMEAVVKKYGFTAETQMAVYCRSGVRASVVYAAFVNVLGFKNVQVYDGSYLEWEANGNKVVK